MAELIITDEERQSKSYLDWDDAALGKCMRWASVEFDKRLEKDGRDQIKGLAVALLYISDMLRFNAQSLTVTANGLTYSGVPLGDLRLTLERLDMPITEYDGADKITDLSIVSKSDGSRSVEITVVPGAEKTNEA